MSYIKKFIITISIIILSIFIISFKLLNYYSYKNKAEQYVINYFKTKYNSNIKIEEIIVGKSNSTYTPYVPISYIEVEYKGKKCSVIMNTFTSSNEIYDNCQSEEITEGFIKYIDERLNNKNTNYMLSYYNDKLFFLPNNFPQLKKDNVIKEYFDGNNYKDVLKNGSAIISYDNTDIDENIVKEIIKEFPKDFSIKIDAINKKEKSLKLGANEIICIEKRMNNNKTDFDCSKYRKDIGNIKVYSADKEKLEKANITTTSPFDINKIEDDIIKGAKVVSPFYKTTTTIDNYTTIREGEGIVTFNMPIEPNLNKNYAIGLKLTRPNGKIEYDYDYIGNSSTINFVHDASLKSIEHVLLEVNKY